MKIINIYLEKNGPSTEPWGIPHVNLHLREVSLLTLTTCCRLLLVPGLNGRYESKNAAGSYFFFFPAISTVNYWNHPLR